METTRPRAGDAHLTGAKGRGSRLRDGNERGFRVIQGTLAAKGRGSRLRDGNKSMISTAIAGARRLKAEVPVCGMETSATLTCLSTGLTG